MKKIVIILVLALLLVGCGKHDAKISNSNEVLWTGDGKDYKSEQLYEYLKSQDYTGIIIRDVIQKVASFEGIDTATVRTNSDADVDEIASTYGDYFFQYYGTTEDEYRKSHYSESLLTELMKKTINESFDTYVNDYSPYQAEVAYFDDIEIAKSIIEDVAGGEHTFAYSALENGYQQEIVSQVYTDLSELPVEVKEYCLNTDKLGLSDVIQSSTYTTDADGNSTITPRYYLVNIISKNVDDFKDEFISWIIENDMNATDVVKDYMTKYGMKIYDQRTFELIEKTYGDFH